jgi:hypothetical protein
MDQEMAAAMLDYREDEENDLKNAKWYKDVAGMGDIDLGDLVRTASTHFEIDVAGLKDTMTKWINVAVERKDGVIRVLSWKMG